MNNDAFTRWCQTATKQIKYGPDRKAVTEELQAHLEDHYDSLIVKGISPEEAKRQVLASMGSAEEIAPQLGAIHKPWLGYVYHLVKGVAIVAAVLAVLCTLLPFGSGLHMLISSRNFDFLSANNESLDYISHPNISDYAEGYHFQVTEAGYSASKSAFYCELEILYWPWMDPCQVTKHIWAVDSRGRYFSPEADENANSIGSIKVGGGSSSSGIQLCQLTLSIFDPHAAQWVELHYDRDGRDIVLRIDLTGGAEDE